MCLEEKKTLDNTKIIFFLTSDHYNHHLVLMDWEMHVPVVIIDHYMHEFHMD